MHQVIRTTINQGYNWVVDGDLAQDFDTIDHTPLLRLVWQRISDRRVLRLIRAWLEAGVLTNQGWVPNERGTPQGGVLSPVFVNIYLHEVDRQWHQQ